MAKTGTKTVKYTETEVARVPVMKVVGENGESPLYLKMHIGDGEMNGKKFSIGANVGGGDIIISFDDGPTFVVGVRATLTAIAEANAL